MKQQKQDRAEYMRTYRTKQKAQDNESTKLLRELEASYKKHRKRIEDAMQDASPGTQVFLKYAEALARLDERRRDELVKRGFAPENLAVGTTPAFVFKAHVARDGAVTVTRLREGQPEPKNEVPRNADEDLEERARVIAELEAEFPSDEPVARRGEE